VAWVFLYIMLLMGGVLAVGGTGDLVSAGNYALLFGPGELTKSLFSLGDMIDNKMALQSALAQEYETTNVAQVIKLLADRYDATHQLIIPTPDLDINVLMNKDNPLDGVVAGGRVMKDFYTQLFHAMTGGRTF
jgi:hypothetical protein